MNETPKPTEDPWSIKDLLGGLIGGTILCFLGVWMLLTPEARDHQPSQGTMRLIGKLLDATWGIPGGIVLGLIGFAIFGMTLHQLVTQYNRR